ncbi:Predicted acyltransferase, LPLAT superfamily [Modicisalibacter ilicicola DSM 19980]|uniref:Predicted acyltransferase, LPLAT superfamily n=1 Tax=Modicisalibacter ilicicola DSM 19980 TaxID=1121942 RepID=A0A1M4ZTW5_9GAMM|nr:glycosyl transferase [Halomonas ilicicola]SHF21411.1 Predicted acyltransferase, LPLAT superfamily [Halomonas ilicicola DSM 19980]
MSSSTDIPRHWARIQESGSVAGMRIMVWIRRHLGRLPFRVMLGLVIVYYYLCQSLPRRASREYLQRIWPLHAGHLPRWRAWLGLKHFMAFGQSLMDKVDAWSGVPLDVRLAPEDRACLDRAIRSGRGGLMLVSHVGNLEICSAMSDTRDDFHVTQLMHTRNSRKFNQLLDRSTRRRGPEIVEVTEITPATALGLAERIDAGGFVVIAADRIPIDEQGRVRPLEFLGATALFPEGPFWLAALLRCPIYTLSCLREGGSHRVEFRPFDDTSTLRRADRDAWREAAMQRYVAWLTDQCRRYPLQWFNFFPFWQTDDRYAS